MNTEPEYDEKTCITAGELRSMGVMVSKTIPDCGWIPRPALVGKVLPSNEGTETRDPNTLNIDVEYSFTQPFRWLSVDLTVEKPREI
jgi:hypothetical protein